MPRIEYADEEEFAGQWSLQDANMRRVITGKRGQKVLREMRESLMAMPMKRLITSMLAMNGEVCVLGSLLVHREHTDWITAQKHIQGIYGPPCEDCDHTESAHNSDGCTECITEHDEARIGGSPDMCQAFKPDTNASDTTDIRGLSQEYHISQSLVWRLVELNDEVYAHLTPEDRYTKVLAWVERHIT